MEPKEILDLAELNTAVSDLDTYYLYGATESITSTLLVSWDDFVNATFDTGQLPAEVAINIIYGLDSNNKWMVTLNRCSVSAGVITLGDNYMQITEGGATILSGNPPAVGVTEYFSGVNFYNAKEDKWVALDSSINVNSCTFLWQKFQDLHDDNVTTSRTDPSLFSLVFKPVCFDYTNIPDRTLVNQAHCVALYMSYNGSTCLSNTHHGNLLDKAADEGDPCPTSCPN